MKTKYNIIKICVLFIFVIGITDVNAQCTTYANGPYSNISAAGCNGETVASAFGAWENEAYFSNVTMGGGYTFSIPNCTATAWGGVVEITLIEGGTVTPTGGGVPGGTIVGGTTTVMTGCSITFTATITGSAYFVLTTVGGCGGPELQVDNGLPTITTNSGVPCGVCGDAVCESTENYCGCNADCDCSGTNPLFITGYDTGAFAGTATPVAYCSSEVNTGGSNFIPEAVYVPFAPLGNQVCVTDWDLTTDFGSTFASTDPISPSPDVADGFIALLELTDADLVASSGIVTITFTDATTGNGCTFDLVVDMSTAVDATGAPWAGTAAAACPGICGPAAASLNTFDCGTDMVEFDVTDVGTPPMGFDYELYQVNDATVTPVLITTVNQYMVGPIDPAVTYTIGVRATGAGDPGCNVQTGALYPDCYTPAAGCTDLLAGVGDMEGTTWVEVSDTNSVATAVAIVDGSNPLADAQSAFLGGWGAATRTSLTSMDQSVTFGTDPVNLIFWLSMTGCDSANDVFNITIDGTNEYTTDALSAYPMTTNGAVGNCGDGHWYEITIPLGTTYSDGAAHAVQISAVEAGTNGGNTNFFVDEMIIESCGTAGPCPPEYTAANGNRLTGTETGAALYETDGILESDQTIDATADVDYESAVEVNLLNDFETILGAIFDAYIDGCGTPLTSNNAQKRSLGDDDDRGTLSQRDETYDFRKLDQDAEQATNQLETYKIKAR